MADRRGNWSRDGSGQWWWVDGSGQWWWNDGSGQWWADRRDDGGSAGSGWTQGKRRKSGVAVSAASSSGVAASAASRSGEPHDVQWWSENIPDGLRYFDNQNMQDMTQEEQTAVKNLSRRVD